jgi:hypothetical protein
MHAPAWMWEDSVSMLAPGLGMDWGGRGGRRKRMGVGLGAGGGRELEGGLPGRACARAANFPLDPHQQRA